MIYALDSNVIIEILKGNKTVCARRDNALAQNGDLVIPIVADYEIWRGFYYRSAPSKEKMYLAICGDCDIIKMTDGIWKRGARIYAYLRGKGLKIDDFDILIAAMCIENNYTLVTHNIRHFEGIDDLLTEDWQGTQ
jgi:predicted nucleic acid-binding protein